MTASLDYVLAQMQRWASPRLQELSDAVLLERFIQGRDESAFAALVARHGAMVLRSCRRILGDAHEAEDAFQATFLVLARKAHTLRQPNALPGFLHSIARRIALKARTKAAACVAQNTDATSHAEELPETHSDPLARLTAREFLTVLDEEVSRLPVAQRSAVLLCCLEGRSQEEAANLLGWTPGSLKGHLERGRRRLQDRLQRRGIALSTALALVMVARDGMAGRVPALLLQSTVRVALHGGIGGTVPALAQSILYTMFLPKFAGMMAVTLTVALAASTAAVWIYRGSTVEVPEDKKPAVLPASKNASASKPQARTDALGDPLPEGAFARLGTVRFRHGGPIHRLLFTTDGSQLVSHGHDGVRIWDKATGKQAGSLIPPPAETQHWSVGSDLSPDGKKLAVVHGSDSAIDIWDVRRGKKIDSFGRGDYSLVRLSPDGKRVVVCAKFSGVELWDVARREKIRSWKAHKRQVWFLVFTPDSRHLLTADPNGQLRLWEAATGQQIREFTISNYSVENLNSLPLSPDGKLLAVIQDREKPAQAGGESTRKTCISVWDTATGQQVQQLTCPVKREAGGFTPRFTALTFTTDGKQLLTSGPDQFLRVWDPITGKELRKVALGPRGGLVLALSKDGKTLAAGTGSAIQLFDLPSGRAYEPPEGQAMALAHSFCSVLTPDGRTAVTSSWENAPLIWDVDARRIRQQCGKHSNYLASVQISGDGKTLFSRGDENALRIWDLTRGEERSHVQLDFGGGKWREMIVSRDDRFLFLADPNGIIHQLDAATGKERGRFQGSKFLWGMDCSPDGRSLVGWSGDRRIRIWDTANGRLQREYSVPREIKGRLALAGKGEELIAYSAALSPDGRLLAVGSLWVPLQPEEKPLYSLIFKDLRTGRDLVHCDPLPSPPECIRFSPDSRMLAWSGGFLDPTIHLLEVASGRERRRFVGHRGSVHTLCFSASGERLLSASGDTTALVWDLGVARAPHPATAAELESLWDDLAGKDAPRAYRAIHRLAAAPDDAVPFVRKHLRPAPVVDEKQLARLIADLDSDDFAKREKATMQLKIVGESALLTYRKALEGKPSLEMRRRLEDLQSKAQAAWWSVAGERLRSLRTIEALELAATPEAREVLQTIAAGGSGARLTEESKAALERLTKRGGK